jgi:cystathionine beta-lyase
MKYNFDQIIDRNGTDAVKVEGLKEIWGRTDLIPLWVADMDFATAPFIVEAIQKRCENPVLGYTSKPDSYFNAIIHWVMMRYEMKVEKEMIQFVPGIVPGIGMAMNALTKEGDKVLVQPPVYHPFMWLTERNKRTLVLNPLKCENGVYQMDMEAFREQVKGCKLFILCNPHNPVGIQWDADVMRQVAKICRENGIVVVSDEIHGDLMLYGKPHIPFVEVSDDARAITITLGAPSKTFNIPGLVSSWMVIKDEKLRSEFYNWLEVNEFSSPTLFATIGAEVAYTHGEEWLNEMLAYVEGSIDIVEDFLEKNIPQIKIFRPQASFLLWLDCRELQLTQPQLVDLFVKKAHLALNDGTMFGEEGAGFMRLNIGSPRKVILEALQSLADAVKAL